MFIYRGVKCIDKIQTDVIVKKREKHIFEERYIFNRRIIFYLFFFASSFTQLVIRVRPVGALAECYPGLNYIALQMSNAAISSWGWKFDRARKARASEGDVRNNANYWAREARGDCDERNCKLSIGITSRRPHNASGCRKSCTYDDDSP